MEITTKPTIQEQIEKKSLDKIIKYAEDLEQSGVPREKILDRVDGYVQSKINEFYLKEKHKVLSIGDILKDLDCKKDSKAEAVLYHLLKDNKIDFEFQVKIGQYRVDYLIAGFLIFEGDGPQHRESVEYDKRRDAYLSGLGYEVMRLEWKMVALMTDVVLNIIKEKIKAVKV